MKEMTTKEQLQVFFKACFYGLIGGVFGGCIGLVAWSYELQEYVINYPTAFNSACTFSFVAFFVVICTAIYPVKIEKNNDEEIPGFFDRKKDR